jgi:hypothetical protein
MKINQEYSYNRLVLRNYDLKSSPELKKLPGFQEICDEINLLLHRLLALILSVKARKANTEMFIMAKNSSNKGIQRLLQLKMDSMKP